MSKKYVSIVTLLSMLLVFTVPVGIADIDTASGTGIVYAASSSTAINKGIKLSQKGKKLTVKWGKVKKADGYMVYVGYRGKKFEKAATIKGNKTFSFTVKKISKKAIDPSKRFMAYVVAYKLNGKKKVQIAKSKKVFTDGASYKKAVKIKVFETSDLHGYIMDTSGGKVEEYQYRLPYMAGVVDKARENSAYDDVLLLDGGDIYQGNTISNLTNGDVMRAALDVMDYDAVSLGNHEFDWDVTKYATDADGTVPAYNIGSFSGDPDIPVVAATLYDAATGKRVGFTKDYVVVTKGGKRIAIIGYIPDFKKTLDVETSKIAPYEIKEDLVEFGKLVSRINEAEKPDVTVILAHQNPITVATAMDPAQVDLVCGGHEHAGISGVSTNGIPYIQADYNGKGFASATISIDSKGKVSVDDGLYTKITDNEEALYDTPENASNFDSTVLKIAKEGLDTVAQTAEVLGYITTDVQKYGYLNGKNGSTTGGNFITGLMLRATKKYGAVAAFYNRNGYRYNMELNGKDKRNVTVWDVYSINPFGNKWLVYELTGAELKKQIEIAWKESNYGDQMSGLKYEYINKGTDDAPDVEVVSITLDDGTKVDIKDTTKTYKICTSNYNATLPGGVFEGKTAINNVDEAPVDNETIIQLLREEGKANNGLIKVDTTPRGTEVKEAATTETKTVNRTVYKYQNYKQAA